MSGHRDGLSRAPVAFRLAANGREAEKTASDLVGAQGLEPPVQTPTRVKR
jgi:hypothetical protein